MQSARCAMVFPPGPPLRSCRFPAFRLSARRIVRSTSPNFHSTGAGISPAAFHYLRTTPFGAIRRSKFPTCRLQFRASPLSGSVRFQATPLRSGFEAIAGRYPHPEPVFRTASQRCSACFSPPLPFRPAALRIKAFSLSSPCKLAAVSVSGPFGNRSVNPGTV